MRVFVFGGFGGWDGFKVLGGVGLSLGGGFDCLGKVAGEGRGEDGSGGKWRWRGFLMVIAGWRMQGGSQEDGLLTLGFWFGMWVRELDEGFCIW